MNFKFLASKTNSSFKGNRRELSDLPVTAVKKENYKILFTPEAFRERILELIKNAKKRIMISALYLQNDEAGNLILSALYDAKNKNNALDVSIYVDFHRAQRGLIGKGPQIGNNAWYREMKNKDPEHAPQIYGVPVKRREVFGVLHLKGFVFDNTVLYSGASLNNVYLGYKEQYRLDRYHEIESMDLADSMCNFVKNYFKSNPAVQDLSSSHIQSAKILSHKIHILHTALTEAKYTIPNNIITEGYIGITPLCGIGKKNNQLNTIILRLIESAKSSITIFTPYFNLPKQVQSRLNQALNEGIHVTIVAGDKEANDFYMNPNEHFCKISAIPYIYEMNLRDFIAQHENYIEANILDVMLWKNGTNTYHVKGITIDDKDILITGNNLNPRAFGLDLENGLLVRDNQQLLLKEFEKEKEYLLQHTKRISSHTQITSLQDYPENIRNFIIRTKKIGAQWLISKLL